MLAGQFLPLGSQHIRFHDALLGGHRMSHISEEVRHGTNPFGKLATGAAGRQEFRPMPVRPGAD